MNRAAGSARRARLAPLGLAALLGCVALSGHPAWAASQLVRDDAGNLWSVIDDPADGAQGYVLQRLKADGLRDPRFGRAGLVALSANASEFGAGSLQVERSGRIWVGGWGINGGLPQAVIKRLLPDGQPDPQWGVRGQLQFSPSGFSVKPNDILPLADGSVLVAGVAANSTWTSAIVFRLRPDGSTDPSFGAGGVWLRQAPGVESTATSLEMDADGTPSVAVALRGETVLAERWTLGDGPPQRALQQRLMGSADGEDLRLSWGGGAWSFILGDPPRSWMTPAMPAARAGGAQPAGEAAAPGHAIFNPFGGQASAAPPPAPAPEEGWSMGWIVTGLAALGAMLALLRGRRR